MFLTTALAAVLFSAIPQAAATDERPAGEFTFIVNGKPAPSTRAAPKLQAFKAWCGNDCAPSTQIVMRNVDDGEIAGYAYTWTKPFEYSDDGKTVCFSEFAEFAMRDGSVYAHCASRGTCGAFMDTLMRTETHSGPTGVLMAAGGDGKVVGGTNRYKDWIGPYTDRLYVEFNAVDGISYYDQLFWKVSAYGPGNGYGGGR